jgi:hypothetical protein
VVFYCPDEGLSLTERLSALLTRVSESRSWSIGPPLLVDVVDERDDATPCQRRIGGLLEIFSAVPPHTLPAELDRQNFEEVSALVVALQEFSLETRAKFEFELDGESIGSINQGHIDRSLEFGFLDEWRRNAQPQH